MVETQRQNVLTEFERLRRLLVEEEQLLLQRLEEEELEVLPPLRESAARLGQQSARLAELIAELEGRCQLPALGLPCVCGVCALLPPETDPPTQKCWGQHTWPFLDQSVLGTLEGTQCRCSRAYCLLTCCQDQEYFSYPLTGAVVTPTRLVLMQLEIWLKGKKKHCLLHLVSESECPNIGTVAGEVDRFLWFL